MFFLNMLVSFLCFSIFVFCFKEPTNHIFKEPTNHSHPINLDSIQLFCSNSMSLCKYVGLSSLFFPSLFLF